MKHTKKLMYCEGRVVYDDVGKNWIVKIEKRERKTNQ
jgi:hypothetical protein